MSLIDAYKAYGGLTAEQKQFLKEKRIDAEYPPDAWIAFLKGVATYDRHGDSLRKAMGWTATVGIIVGGLGAIFAEEPLLLLLALVGIIALAFFIILRRVDLPDSIHGFILPVVALLREDIEGDGMLHIKLDLRGGTKEDKKESSTDYSDRGRQVCQTFYNDPWMIGDTKLVDGSMVQWEINDHIRERRITRRNARGKTKTKYKYKVQRAIDVRVGLRGDDYTVDSSAAAGAGGDRVAVKRGEKRNVIRVRRALNASALGTIPDVKDLLDPITAAYRRVSLQQEGGKA